MGIKIFSITILFCLITFHSSYAQLNKNDILLGISGAYEVDNKVAISSLNFEFEKFDFNSAVLGIGASLKYCNFSGSFNKNSFIALMTNLNFNKISDGKLIPFIGLTGGTNFEFSDNLYGIHIGCRYSSSDHILIYAKYGLTNRSPLSPEIGIDYKF